MPHSGGRGEIEKGRESAPAPCAPQALPYWTLDEGAVVNNDAEEREAPREEGAICS